VTTRDPPIAKETTYCSVPNNTCVDEGTLA
jgi:hypothetical protein